MDPWFRTCRDRSLGLRCCRRNRFLLAFDFRNLFLDHRFRCLYGGRRGLNDWAWLLWWCLSSGWSWTSWLRWHFWLNFAAFRADRSLDRYPGPAEATESEWLDSAACGTLRCSCRQLGPAEATEFLCIVVCSFLLIHVDVLPPTSVENPIRLITLIAAD